MPGPAVDTGWPVTASASLSTSTTLNITTPATAGANRLIVVAAVIDGSGTSVTPSGLSLTWTRIDVIASGTTQETSIWAAWAASTLSAGTITLTRTGTTATTFFGTAWAFSGTADGSVTITSAFGAHGHVNNAATPRVTLAGVLSTSGIVVVANNENTSAALTAATNTTIDGHFEDTNNGAAAASGHLNVSSSGSVTVGFTNSLTFDQAVAAEVLAGATLTPLGQPSLPDAYLRRAWNPERSWSATPLGPAAQVVVVPRSPVPPILPERFARGVWNPERTHVSWWPPSSVYPFVPFGPPALMLPDRFLRPVWNPERSFAAWVGPASQVVVVPASPVPPAQPDSFLRPAWNPDRSSTALLWVAPPPPVLTAGIPGTGDPAMRWVFYDKSFVVGPALIILNPPPQPSASISASPATVMINEPFMVVATLANPSAYPLYVSYVVTLGSPSTVTFSEVTTLDVTGAGQMVVGAGLAPVDSGSSRDFTWWGVAFAPGTYQLSAAIIDSKNRYYLTGAAASVTVTGPA